MRNSLIKWYHHEGFIQFLLGNMWNCVDLRNEGRLLLIVSWIVILFSFIPLIRLLYC